MHVAVVSSRVDALEEVFAGALKPHIPEGVTLRFYADSDALDDWGRGAEIALGAPDVLAPLLERMPHLRWVQSTWAGVTPFFDVPRRDYQLTGVKDIFGASMSEYCLGWVLALERSILSHAQAVSWQPRIDRGLSALRVGIAGVGSIGVAVARAFQPFVQEIRGLNSDGRAVAGCDRCFATSERLSFARDLDVLIMILPDTPATDGLVDANLLDALAPGALLINGGRANALDLDAALRAKASGQLKALVLDVFEREPLDDDHPLWKTPGVFITSHTAAPTDIASIARVFLDNLQRYQRGEPLQGVIDFDRGY
ncbi:D-2-hydroxyacid dehydrogenase [Congregibacter litoralis]|uniref:Phosphoglycerate dehydrogenase n=1 Tax=Congregibacter litoralis KT71 TaxID=314285 RepID=A4ACB8_9GAMM|nr:D-2-hydroxyacid dehydrogenase [Congregibacter litoralis]EAQ96346.1 Phosphoglycerate dehydrogenase [Congregibacter litoralis KT71]